MVLHRSLINVAQFIGKLQNLLFCCTSLYFVILHFVLFQILALLLCNLGQNPKLRWIRHDLMVALMLSWFVQSDAETTPRLTWPTTFTTAQTILDKPHAVGGGYWSKFKDSVHSKLAMTCCRWTTLGIANDLLRDVSSWQVPNLEDL